MPFVVSLPEHIELIDLTIPGTPLEESDVPGLVVENPEVPLHRQRLLGFTAFGGIAEFSPACDDEEALVAGLVITGLDYEAAAEYTRTRERRLREVVENIFSAHPTSVNYEPPFFKTGLLHTLVTRTRFGDAPVTVTDTSDSAALRALTRTQADITKLVAMGKTNEVIAQYLRTSPEDVEDELRDVYQKAGFGSRVLLSAAVLLQIPNAPDQDSRYASRR